MSMETQTSTCHNVFRSGKDEVSSEAMTALWIHLIQKLEASKGVITAAR